jgi:TRAP-type uncharacterized transport system substrate-binding protein
VVTEEFPLIYTLDSPNDEFARKLKSVLEDSYNVNIRLVKAQNSQSIIDSLESEQLDMGLIENLANKGEGINTVVPIFTKALHLFYRTDLKANSIEQLLYDRTVYIGRKGTVTFEFMKDLFGYYELDQSRITISNNQFESDVLAVFSVVMQEDDLVNYDGYKLFSLSEASEIGLGSVVEGVSLKFPRVRPYIIPKGTYGDLTRQPVVTIATDMIFVVREGMWQQTISDLSRSIFANRDQFVHLNPSFYYGIIEDFDRSKLSYPLHEGARAFLDRDEPSFLERYAELGGVIFTVIIAIGSGLVSLSKWRKQKKKDKIDVFYEHLMRIKNEMSSVNTVKVAKQKIQEVKDDQNKAFDMLIREELEANDSFRIFMELSKETITDIRLRLRLLKSKGS